MSGTHQPLLPERVTRWLQGASRRAHGERASASTGDRVVSYRAWSDSGARLSYNLAAFARPRLSGLARFPMQTGLASSDPLPDPIALGTPALTPRMVERIDCPAPVAHSMSSNRSLPFHPS